MWHSDGDGLPYFDYEECLSSLSKKEKAIGEAIRIVRCLRGSSGNRLVWVVLHLTRTNQVEAIRLSGFSRVFQKLVHCCFLQQREICSCVDFTLWYVSEYAVTAPFNLRTFGIKTKRSTCVLSWSERNRLLDTHYKEIRNAAADSDYHQWFLSQRCKKNDLSGQTGPLISIISPLFKTPPNLLKAMIDSVLGQSYAHWELILVNASPDDKEMSELLALYEDNRIRVILNPDNNGISGNTNVGIQESNGDYVCFLDHDDFIEPDALSCYVDEIVRSLGTIDLLYCDEDSINENGKFVIPLFKPPLNIDLLYSNNYVIHWLMVSRRVIEYSERSSREVDGAQDYDLTFKAIEYSRNVVRIPRVLYHWRIHIGSTNINPEAKPYAQYAGEKAIKEHLQRRRLSASVSLENVPSTYKCIFELKDSSLSQHPTIGVLIGSETNNHSLVMAISKYQGERGLPCDVLRIDPHQTIESAKSLNCDFTFVCFEDLKSVSHDFVETLLGYLSRGEVAAVSPKIIREDGLIEYAGLCVCPDGRIMYLNKYLPESDEGYLGRAARPYDYMVINPNCFIIKTQLLIEACTFFDSFQNHGYQFAAMFTSLFYEKYNNVYTPFALGVLSRRKSLLSYCIEGSDGPDSKRYRQLFGSMLSDGDPTHSRHFSPYSPYYRLNTA